MKAIRKSKQVLLGYSPEAKRVDSLTHELRKRSGVHHYKKTEIASVFDLITVCRTQYNKAKRKDYPCTINGWYEILDNAFNANALRLVVTDGHVLTTDAGQVPIHKAAANETYFVAIEDFPKYLDLVKAEQPTIAKRLKAGWKLANEEKRIANF
jgi:hypothetical protein